jgi:hypothetical protein
MNTYLTRIAEYLIRAHRLRPHHDNADEQAWRARRFGPPIGGRKRGRKEVVQFRLCHIKAADYLDFQERRLLYRYRAGRKRSEALVSIARHLTANASGSIRRIYTHAQGSEEVSAVRSFSLKNYYTLADNQLALLLMINEDRLAWLRELPVTYYPVSNKELRSLGSIAAFLAHFAGPGTPIPKRIQQALSLSEKIALFQLVPANHLNDIAATMKRHEAELRGQPSANRILLCYYRDVMPGEKIRAATVYSYTGACRHMGQKVNMRIRSGRRLSEERVAVTRRRTFKYLIDIRTSPELILERTDFGDIQLELINSKERLWEEARRMGSCVDTYCHAINDGKCAIYHVVFKDKHYTLEVVKRGDGSLYAEQLKGALNAIPPKRLQKKIDAIFSELAQPRAASQQFACLNKRQH